MMLIADEPRIAEVVSNELLLLVFFIVSGLEAPAADVLWAKRAFKEKMLAMLLASARVPLRRNRSGVRRVRGEAPDGPGEGSSGSCQDQEEESDAREEGARQQHSW